MNEHLKLNRISFHFLSVTDQSDFALNYHINVLASIRESNYAGFEV